MFSSKLTGATCKLLLTGICMLIAAFNVAAQPPAKRVLYVIDAVPIKRGESYFLKADNVASVRVSNTRGQDILDSVFIKTKDHAAFQKLLNSRFLSPDEIAYQNIKGYNVHSQVLFFWNGKLLIDTAGKAVPQQYLEKVEVLSTSKTAYAATLPGAVILKIYVKVL